MKSFNNIQTFAENYYNKEKIPKKLCRLLLFTYHSKFNRNISSRLYNSDIIVSNIADGEDYAFIYEDKIYPFSVFSDKDLQKVDKKILESTKRIIKDILRTLKLACSMDLVNPRIAIGNSIVGVYKTLIVFQENGIDKVIDYTHNLIMSKNDYYELFKFNELNVVDKFDLYNIYCIMDKLGNFEHIYEYLIFTKEIFNELSKKKDFAFFTKKYDKEGINVRNYLLFGYNCDRLFFQPEDIYHMKYAKLIRELEDFTENPTKKSKHISYVRDQDKYMLKARNFGYFTFDLLSNLISDKRIKEKLLSTNRYGDCHKNSILITKFLSDKDKASAYVVGGKSKENENDYTYHSWVEIDEKNVVIDFNHNIVMNRDEYYKLFEIVPISKVSVLEMKDIIQTFLCDARLSIHPMQYNYFGPELMRDLKKNEAILKK